MANQFDLGKIRAAYRARVDASLGTAETVLEEIVDDGVEGVLDVIETEVTKTGRERAASPSGGHPGRIRSGGMYRGVEGDVYREDGDTVVGKWGWPNPEHYVKYQEEGWRSSPGQKYWLEPMASLPTTFIRAVDQLRARLKRL